MKNIILLFRSNIKRSALTIIIAIILSILLCFSFTAFRNNFAGAGIDNIQIGFLDYDNSSISADFKRYLNEELNISTIENETYDNLTYQLIDRNISAIIEIPKGLEKDGITTGKLPNVITTTLDDYENNAFIKSYINIYFGSINQLITAADGDKTLFYNMFSDYQKQDRKIKQEAAETIDNEQEAANRGLRLSIGFFTMMMTLMSFCLALVVMEDRQIGVFNRIQVSPVKSEQYIIGTSMFAAFSSLVIVIIYCVFLSIGNYAITVPISYLLLVMTLFLFFMLGFALIVALFCKTVNAMTTLLIVLGTIGPILGGAYFPVDHVAQSLQRISKLTPHYWFMQGIKELTENPNKDVRTNIIILSLFAILSSLIAAVKFVQKENSR